jgi:two-component system, OmpR family, KDP operon response regulator KdpE
MKGDGARILVVDDEIAILRALERNLRGHGFQVETAATAAEAIAASERWHPDAVILDLGLPDGDGNDVIRALRSRSAIPVIVLSVRGGDRDKVNALDLGADDYLTKPFSVDELLARVRVMLRHAAGPATGTAPIFRTGDLAVDIEHRLVTVGGREVRLTPTEYDLLRAFLSQPNKVLTATMLLRAVWGADYGSEAHYLHVYVARLRRKLEPDPRRPRYVRTEPGVGYRLVVQESQTPVTTN